MPTAATQQAAITVVVSAAVACKATVIKGCHNQDYLRGGVIGVVYLEDNRDYKIFQNNADLILSRASGVVSSALSSAAASSAVFNLSLVALPVLSTIS